jgi:hypothetical protein
LLILLRRSRMVEPAKLANTMLFARTTVIVYRLASICAAAALAVAESGPGWGTKITWR